MEDLITSDELSALIEKHLGNSEKYRIRYFTRYENILDIDLCDMFNKDKEYIGVMSYKALMRQPEFKDVEEVNG